MPVHTTNMELTKLRPDRDLQCYYQQPTAIAAISAASETGLTVSGSWRQQFDWAVLEWNRDNVIEHPALRNLPDGDLRGLSLSYEEVRTNCVPIDSKTYDAIGWSYLRIWEESGGVEQFHWVPLLPYATAVEGNYVPATATFILEGIATAGDVIELAWLDRHANTVMGASLENAVAELAGFINAQGEAGGITAAADGASITLTYTGGLGANGNRVGVYGSVSGARTESWSPSSSLFTGGVSPTRWRLSFDFDHLIDSNHQSVPVSNVRKIRWTWAAELQWQHFARTEFSVALSDWQVTGANRVYQIAGAGSRRIEDDSAEITYFGSWTEERGNYSGGSIRRSKTAGNRLVCKYASGSSHRLYLGTRMLASGGAITVQVDSAPAQTVSLTKPAEDYLVRVPLGEFAGQVKHTVTVTHSGVTGSDVFVDFLEIALPSTTLPTFIEHPTTTLATDWDTYHSIAVAPERTAWLVDTLGFKGRANHYVGALWFYELVCPENAYATATVEFSGSPEFGATTEIVIAGSPLQHLNYFSDTAESIAKGFELLVAAGSSAVWARAEGAVLTIVARAMGTAGNAISLSASTGSGQFTASVSSPALSGGVTGKWLTDLTVVPRLNRAARDWSRSYYQALKARGIEVTAAFSMELKDGDVSLAAGIAQRYPNGPVLLNTPAVQTNFGPQSTAFWKQVYRDMADIMVEAGVAPYLQFGEVQWWYFANSAGMPFYDDYTKQRFEATYHRPIAIILNQNDDPARYPEEAAFLPTLIGEFTDAVMTFVRETHSSAKFEVLYPPDTNDYPLNRVINYPAAHWTAANLECLKTENFTYTGNRDLNKARESIEAPRLLGFPGSKSSHLVGIWEYTAPWEREHSLSLSEGVESVVLFALDQFCLIGYTLSLQIEARRTLFMGG
jgi:hypothetical protein